jgi:acetyl-CoA carboxylase beta subunit
MGPTLISRCRTPRSMYFSAVSTVRPDRGSLLPMVEMSMPESRFDQMSHTFHCQNVKCAKAFQVVLRKLLKANKVVCPECGHSISIRESKKMGAIRKDFDTAEKLDTKAKKVK